MSVTVNRLILSTLLSIALVFPMAPLPAHAGIVSTADALAIEQDGALATVESYLQREEVANELVALGVTPEMALARARTLSQEELDAMAGRIDDMPAGSIGVIEVLGVTFLVLLILHLTGVLRVFR